MNDDSGSTPRTLRDAQIFLFEEGRGLTQTSWWTSCCYRMKPSPWHCSRSTSSRLRHCGEDVEAGEGIISIKTGGCPEDCHFSSQSGPLRLPRPRALPRHPELVRSAKETAATGATGLHRRRGPRPRHQADEPDQVRHRPRRRSVNINIACSLGMLTQRQLRPAESCGVHRYNHNLDGAQLLPEGVTTHDYEERLETCNGQGRRHRAVCRALIGMGEPLERPAELAAQLAALEHTKYQLNLSTRAPEHRWKTRASWTGRDALPRHRRVPPRHAPHRPAIRWRARTDPRPLEHHEDLLSVDQRRHRQQLHHHPGRLTAADIRTCCFSEHFHLATPQMCDGGGRFPHQALPVSKSWEYLRASLCFDGWCGATLDAYGRCGERLVGEPPLYSAYGLRRMLDSRPRRGQVVC